MAGIIQENFCHSRMTVFGNFKHHIKTHREKPRSNDRHLISFVFHTA